MDARMLRPAQYATHHLIEAILKGAYPPGSTLPAERVLAERIGVTRPTLREVLQRLASEGWITIRHGKPTVINDYWRSGGLTLLGTLARYLESLPDDFIDHLLEIRLDLVPAMAVRAAGRNPDALIQYLQGAGGLADDPEAFARYDWRLQALMATLSENRIYPMILNDFERLFRTLARAYFELQQARAASRNYYRDLARAVGEADRAAVERISRRAMAESMEIYREVAEARDAGRQRGSKR